VNSDRQPEDQSTRIDWGDIKQVKKLFYDGNLSLNDRHSFNGTGGWTALMIACWIGCVEVVEFLLDKSKSSLVNLQDDKGWSALKRASFKNHYRIVELLLKQGAMVDLQDDHGWTALMNASRHGDYELAELLLKSDADPNIRRKSGRTALMSASKNGRKEVVILLLKCNAKINAQDYTHGMTALMYATTCGHINTAEKLIAETDSTEVNLQDNKGRSALMIASVEGQDQVVQLLLGKRAAVDICDNDGQSAPTLAEAKWHHKVASYLRINWLAKVGIYLHV
jgi:serine/threonine-protein phosphatase 6 regulatory ankyrin repeat subunit B